MIRKPLKVEERICRITWGVKASRYFMLLNDGGVGLEVGEVGGCCGGCCW